MYLTHTFAHRETLTRAHSWLTRHGFHPRHNTSGVPRIMIVDDPYRLAAAKMLINAAESADPDGFPGLWDEARLPHYPAQESVANIRPEPAKPHTSVIGWHPLD
jgi:hypothetical protein